MPPECRVYGRMAVGFSLIPLEEEGKPRNIPGGIYLLVRSNSSPCRAGGSLFCDPIIILLEGKENREISPVVFYG